MNQENSNKSSKKSLIVIAISLVIGLIIGGVGFIIYNQSITSELPDNSESGIPTIPEEDREDFPLLSFLDDLVNVEPEPNPDLVGKYVSKGGTIIKENLGLTLEERASNYLAANDLLKGLAANEYKIEFTERYMLTDGKRHAYQNLTSNTMEVAASDGISVNNRYYLNEGFFRMFSNPEFVYVDMVKEGEDSSDNTYSIYDDTMAMDENDLYFLADCLVSALNNEDPVLAILSLSETLENELLATVDQSSKTFENYDYQMMDVLSHCKSQIVKAFGQNWSEVTYVEVDRDSQRILIYIGDTQIANLRARYNNIIQDFELVLN